MWKSIQDTLEKTGDVITKQAETIMHSPHSQPSSSASSQTTAAENKSEVDVEQLADRFKKGWGSMLQATKQVVQEARVAVEKEQTRIAARLSHPDRPKRRDPSLPLDVEALRDAEVVYVTDRILTLSHPAMQSTVDADITPARKLAAVGQLLYKRHGGRYMVWNLSEVEYDLSIFDDQVLLFSFPGSPSPPLGLLLKLLISMESWLKADERNVAVVHCLTGKGRTSTVVACFLCWMGEAGFRDVHQALDYIANCKRCPTEELTIPSQRRYIQYFANMLDGVRPSQPPLMLKRIILSEAPRFAKGPPRDNLPTPPDDAEDDYDQSQLLMGCAPYLQIFKAGQLVFTTAASLNYNQSKDELPFCQVADGTISFHVENVVQGDILIRCRHLTAQGQRVSMFRAAFHTGYVPPNVMRITKAQLDGACTDKRFPDDFFLDIIFEPCDAETASKHLSGKADAAVTAEENVNEDSQNEASERRQRGTMAGAEATQMTSGEAVEASGATVTASAYDSMLHRDSRFWDVIAARRQQHAQQSQYDDMSEDPYWGPTIGRRRQFELRDKLKSNEPKSDVSVAMSNADANAATALSSFSIGGEFDFMPSEEHSKQSTGMTESGLTEPKQRDELMEALNALENDETSSPEAGRRTRVDDTEEIQFDSPEARSAQGKELFKDAKAPEAAERTEEAFVATTTGCITNGTEKKIALLSTEDSQEPPPAGVTSLLDDADLDITDDVDAFLASAGENEPDLDDVGDVDDLDFDDDEIDDLENFLTSK